MTYKLVFKEEALKEWKKLEPLIREQFKKKLIERLEAPHVESTKLRGMKDCYKIKFGYRLVYQVRDLEIVVSVVAVGKRDRNQVYKAALSRL
jgi:mRNA interferase RelE/StbE